MSKVIGFYYPENAYGCFSNWYESKFTVDGTEYWCAEQFMTQQKALLFGAEETAKRIMLEKSPEEIKRLGRESVPDYDAVIWDAACQYILRKGLLCKFQQNEAIRKILLETGEAILAKCAPEDHKWGIGLDAADDRVNRPYQWCGRNVLGYILMLVRSDIRTIDAGKKPLKKVFLHNICVERADITTLSVDVIVNAANTSLLGGGGVDGAIHSAAGPKLLEECRGLHGAETGEVKMTEGYNLPARKVIHTPGPVWCGGQFHEAEQLANCWRRSLAMAAENDLHSIAFPSISTGVYGYPLKEAAAIAMKETVEFVQFHPDYNLKVIVAAFDEETRAVYEQARNFYCGAACAIWERNDTRFFQRTLSSNIVE